MCIKKIAGTSPKQSQKFPSGTLTRRFLAIVTFCPTSAQNGMPNCILGRFWADCISRPAALHWVKNSQTAKTGGVIKVVNFLASPEKKIRPCCCGCGGGAPLPRATNAEPQNSETKHNKNDILVAQTCASFRGTVQRKFLFFANKTDATQIESSEHLISSSNRLAWGLLVGWF